MARPKKESAELEGVFAYSDLVKLNQDEKKDYSLVVEVERDDISFEEKRNGFKIEKKTIETILPIDFFKGCEVLENGFCPELDIAIVGVIKNGIRAELEF